ncbi:MAG TPA: hypothetical protein VFE23_14230 [Usitatibacter sp.]|nr:hypothetical protein [Usitatibacter sp.]
MTCVNGRFALPLHRGSSSLLARRYRASPGAALVLTGSDPADRHWKEEARKLVHWILSLH